MLRNARIEGRGDSGKGKYGSFGVSDSYVLVSVRSCCNRSAGSSLGSGAIDFEDARS